MKRFAWPRSVTALPLARDGVAAVEFALIIPVFLLILAALLDLGYAFYVKLRIINATTAAAHYAQGSAHTVTAGNLAAFLDRVQTVAISAANLPQPPSVTVRFNNASDASNLTGFYCVSDFPPTWTSTGTASASCGGNVSSGKFVTIAVASTKAPLILSRAILEAAFATNDFAIASMQ